MSTKTDENEVNYYEMDVEDVRKLVFNKIIVEALSDDPNSQTLVLATKILDLNYKKSDTEKSSFAKLSTQELVDKFRSVL